MAPDRRLGQHFLHDAALVSRIAEATGADASTLVVEIGPGPLVLTSRLARRAGAVLAVDVDRRLRAFHDSFPGGGREKVEFLYADALRTDLAAEARVRAEKLGLSRLVLAGNLPFQITSHLLFGECAFGRPWERMVFMVQREVADRIVSPPGGRDYGILTVKLAWWWRVVERFEVPSAAFTPPPAVDAAVVVFEPLPPEERPSPEEWPAISAFVDAAFNQRRKKLYNTLGERWPGTTREGVRAALGHLGLDPDARAETIPARDFSRLHARLKESPGDGLSISVEAPRP